MLFVFFVFLLLFRGLVLAFGQGLRTGRSGTLAYQQIDFSRVRWASEGRYLRHRAVPTVGHRRFPRQYPDSSRPEASSQLLVEVAALVGEQLRRGGVSLHLHSRLA